MGHEGLHAAQDHILHRLLIILMTCKEKDLGIRPEHAILERKITS